MASAPCCALSRASDLVDRSSSFSTMVNWAVCWRNWVPSVGLIGFWYLSWATSSLRHVSFDWVAFWLACTWLVAAEDDASGLTAVVIGYTLTSTAASSLAP